MAYYAKVFDFLSYIVSHWVTPIFFLAFFIAWTLNAFGQAKFDMGQLQGMYVTLRGAGLVEHGINSTLNSPKGQMPAVSSLEGGK